MPRLTYTISEVAEILGLSRSKAYELVAEGAIPVVPLKSRRKLVARSTVERLLGEPAPDSLPSQQTNRSSKGKSKRQTRIADSSETSPARRPTSHSCTRGAW